MIVLYMTEDLIREDIHGVSDRASCRTLLTLVAGLEVFITGLNHFREERTLNLFCLIAWVHRLPR